MEKSLYEIARFVGGEIVGDSSIVIRGVSGITEARPGEITFIADSRYADMLEKTEASAVIVSPEVSQSRTRSGSILRPLSVRMSGWGRTSRFMRTW